METAPSAKTGREPPPVPPNYISLRYLQELRLKEKEEQERRRREEEAAAAAAAAAARREAEREAKAALIKREAELKAERKSRAASWEASGGAKERHREGKAQGQGGQWVAAAHRAPAAISRPMAQGQGAAGKREAAIGGGHVEKGPNEAAHGGGKPRGKGKWKGKLADAAPAPLQGSNPAEVVPASPYGGKPEKKSESKAKGKAPVNQAEESSSTGGPGDPAEAAVLSSRGRFRRGRPAGAGGRSGGETCTGFAPVKTAGLSPPGVVKSDDTGKPNAQAPTRADAAASCDSPDGKKDAPAQAPPASAADGSNKPATGGELRKTVEAMPGGLGEGHRRRQVVVAHAVATELSPRVARCSAGPLRGRSNEAAQQHGRVWVPKAAAAAGSSAGAGL